jgi:protein-disulfide isomerase
MPSQKASKRRRQAAKTPPPPAVRARGQRRASPRVLIAAGVIALLIVVGIILGVVLTGSSNSSSSGSAGKLPDTADVQQLLAGIPQNGNVLGKPTAPVTVIQYVDLQCPFCRQFETEAMPTILSDYVRKGKAKIESRIIAFIGPDSQTGREAALAAGKQNKLFNFTQLMYDNQGTENTGWLNDDVIKSAAASIPGLDANKLQSDRSSASVKSQMDAFDAQAQKAGVNSTPTIYVVHNGAKPQLVKLTSPGDPSALEAAINTG